MAQAVLNYMNDWIETGILTPLRSDGEPSERIRAMSTKIDELYDHGQQACLLAVLSLGDAKNLFHVQIQKALLLWIDSVAQVFVDAGFEPNQAHQKAEDTILQIQGALILAQGLNDPAPFKRVLQRLPQELLG